MLVLSVAAPIWWLWGRSGAPFVVELLDALTRINLILIGLNLLPFRPLDGAELPPGLRAAGEPHIRQLLISEDHQLLAINRGANFEVWTLPE